MRKAAIGIGIPAFLITLGLAASVPEGGDPHSAASGKSPTAGQSAQPAANHRGLAYRYPGDAGIEEDSAVVFHETFEQGLISDLDQRWTNISNSDNEVLAFVSDAPPGSAGKRCLQMTATNGHDTGGHLWKYLDKGYDRLYARFYTKFSPDHPYVHHFVHMGSQRETLFPSGGAGSRPSGTQGFSTGIDLSASRRAVPPGDWMLYSYWCEMRSYQNLDGTGNVYYGNAFEPLTPEPAPRDKWQCVEFMIQCNSAPDVRDGEEAFWIDGKLIGRFAPGTPLGTWIRDKFHVTGVYNTNPQPFEGFLWRTSNEVKINCFWLLYYMASVFENDYTPNDTTIPYNGAKGQVLFDDIVLATQYIGPLAVEPPTGGQSGCDFNGDGRTNIVDVVRLVQMFLRDPQDKRTDYDGDGNCTLGDAITLLIDIVKGNC
ncbi:MAG: hypothetical protein A2Z86_10320 [Candidatus Glassbacteria bacterium GWA2_58_10]|uniref:Dockerin domain-containing protein n=1 Tax=Candidatus Glassbacteria bacterium GWA2_58_10 TaxID=1817865 RepID=A0A1F5YDZ6_9BACT|nr:MAG: hypothetical protein A2Z86_10320 [Candidatus Glassbacteria bacterium GWA2_58_10]